MIRLEKMKGSAGKMDGKTANESSEESYEADDEGESSNPSQDFETERKSRRARSSSNFDVSGLHHSRVGRDSISKRSDKKSRKHI